MKKKLNNWQVALGMSGIFAPFAFLIWGIAEPQMWHVPIAMVAAAVLGAITFGIVEYLFIELPTKWELQRIQRNQQYVESLRKDLDDEWNKVMNNPAVMKANQYLQDVEDK